MDQQYWLNKWQSDDTPWDQAVINPHLTHFAGHLGSLQDKTVLVPLCGTSIDMVWLAQQGVRVIGVELSEAAVREFFQRHQVDFTVSERDGFQVFTSAEITIYCGDFFDFRVDGIDAVYDRACLIALPKDMRERYVNTLTGLLSSGTAILLITADYKAPIMDRPPFPVSIDDVDRLFVTDYSLELLLHQQAEQLPPHLIERQFREVSEAVFLIRRR